MCRTRFVVRMACAGALMLAAGCGHAAASIEAEVHQRLLAERFDAAQDIAAHELARATGNSAAAMRRRLAALELLVDVERTRSRIGGDVARARIAEAQSILAAACAPDDRARARWLALAGLNELAHSDQADHRQRGTGLITQAEELLVHGRGPVAPLDVALVADASTSLALANRRYDEGLAAAQRAEAALHGARTRWEKRWHAAMLGSLGLFESINGRAGALAHARAGADLAAAISGADSVAHADALSRLGQVQMYAGDYAGVRASLQVAVDIYRRRPWLGVRTADRAANSLANAYRRLGDYVHARTLFEEVVAHNEIDAAGHFDEMLPDALDTLAGLENEVGNVARARTLYERALDLEDRLYGATQPLFLEKPLINLANMALRQGDLEAAQRYFERAAALDATDHSGMLTSFVAEGRGDLALAQGRPQQAEDLFAASIESTRSRYGATHRWLVTRYCSLALARARLGKLDAAFDAAVSGERLRIDVVRRIAPALTEEHALNLKRQLGSCSGEVLAVAARDPGADRVQVAWNLVAQSRGLATRLRAARIASARAAADADGRARWARWEKAARDYADALLRGAARKADLDAAHDAFEQAETGLGGAALAEAGLGPAADVAALEPPEGATLVAYADAPHYALDADARGYRSSGHERFAFVRTGGASRLVDLGDAGRADMEIDAWLGQLRDPRSDTAAVDAAGERVRARIWDPLHVGVASRVLVVPVGAVFRVAFSALPDRGAYLVERGWRFHELDTEADLVAPPQQQVSERLLVLAAPDFGPSPSPRSGRCSGFADLAGAAEEARGVAAAWRRAPGGEPTLLLGAAASKAALSASASRFSVLHIATHAFSLGDRCDDAPAARGVTVDALQPRSARALEPGAALAFAGANRFVTDGTTDGILTSTEAATLPLAGVRWVVLAACDTGLGEVVADEGVFGLRRGFRLAGARAVVMSLWRVDDAATARWMAALYAAHWQRHLDTPDAMAAAELETLAARRASGESTHPYFWASFVASGDWR